METLSTIGVLALALLLGCFAGIWGFISVMVVGTIYQWNYSKQQYKKEFDRRILEELREIKYREGK